jgi:hypothetical protein
MRRSTAGYRAGRNAEPAILKDQRQRSTTQIKSSVRPSGGTVNPLLNLEGIG